MRQAIALSQASFSSKLGWRLTGTTLVCAVVVCANAPAAANLVILVVIVAPALATIVVVVVVVPHAGEQRLVAIYPKGEALKGEPPIAPSFLGRCQGDGLRRQQQQRRRPRRLGAIPEQDACAPRPGVTAIGGSCDRWQL
jgi:hypothetical protein